MRIDVYHHLEPQPDMSDAIARMLRPIVTALGRIEGKLMTFASETIALLGQINQSTTDAATAIAEVAQDQADLIDRLANAPSDADRAAIIAELQATRDRLATQAETLRGVAAAYTPVAVEPGTVPGTEPVPTPPPAEETPPPATP